MTCWFTWQLLMWLAINTDNVDAQKIHGLLVCKAHWSIQQFINQTITLSTKYQTHWFIINIIILHASITKHIDDYHTDDYLFKHWKASVKTYENLWTMAQQIKAQQNKNHPVRNHCSYSPCNSPSSNAHFIPYFTTARTTLLTRIKMQR